MSGVFRYLSPHCFVQFEGAFDPFSAFCAATNSTSCTNSKRGPKWLGLPHARIFRAQRRAASRAGTSGPGRPLRPASSAAWSGTAASRALRPRAGWPRQRIQMRPQLSLPHAPPPPEAGAGQARGGATVPAALLPEARTRRPLQAARPYFAGCLRASPAPPRRPRFRPTSPHRRLCPPAARRPLPVPAGSSPPPPLAPLPRRRRRERAGDERVNPGLFPARRDPELSRALC